MQLLSLRGNGKIWHEGVEDDFASELALEMDEKLENVQMTIAFCLKHGLVEQITEEEYVVTSVLPNIGSEAESTERVRRHRERKKLLEEEKLLALQCNADETKCNTETEIEIEIEQHQEKDAAVVFLESINYKLNNKTALDYNTKSSKLISSLMDLKTEELSRFIKNFGGSSANWGFLIQNPKKIEQFLKEKPKKEFEGSFCQTTGQNFEIFEGS